MPMPKGHKSSHGYSTNKSFDGGEDYRTIADKMTKSGHKMNHATARNIFISAMRKIARPVHSVHGIKCTDESIERTARDPRFQAGIAEILGDIKVC